MTKIISHSARSGIEIWYGQTWTPLSFINNNLNYFYYDEEFGGTRGPFFITAADYLSGAEVEVTESCQYVADTDAHTILLLPDFSYGLNWSGTFKVHQQLSIPEFILSFSIVTTYEISPAIPELDSYGEPKATSYWMLVNYALDYRSSNPAFSFQEDSDIQTLYHQHSIGTY